VITITTKIALRAGTTMNCIPVPDEILKKIIQYIHPAFQYEKYVKDRNNYKSTTTRIERFMHDHDEIAYGSAGVEERIMNSREMVNTVCHQLEYLDSIQGFLEINRAFLRPSISNELTEHQYLRQYDVHFTEKNIERLERNAIIRRGVWEDGDNQTEINVQNDINHIHMYGTVRDLVFACIVNNDSGFIGVLKKSITGKFSRDTDIILFINKHYPPEINNNEDLRKRLVNRLIKI